MSCESDLALADLALTPASSSSAHTRLSAGTHASASLYHLVSFQHSHGLNLAPGFARLENVIRPLDEKDVVLDVPESVEADDTEDDEENEDPARCCKGDRPASPLSEVIVVLLPPDPLRTLSAPF